MGVRSAWVSTSQRELLSLLSLPAPTPAALLAGVCCRSKAGWPGWVIKHSRRHRQNLIPPLRWFVPPAAFL